MEQDAARNAAKRCKTIRHPYVMRVIEVIELEDAKNGNTIYIITEPVTPLESEIKAGALPEAAVAWGLRTVVSVAAFLHKGGLMHGNIHLGSIFTNRAGDWKLGNFELLCDPRASGTAAFAAAKELLPRKLQPPELSRGNWPVLEQAAPGTVDSWLLGILIYEVFNGRLERPDQLMDTSKIPPQLTPDYTRLLSGTVPARLPVGELLKNSFFDQEFCHMQEFLENLNVKEPAEKERFFLKLTDQVAGIPPKAAKYKVLPALVENLEYGGGTARILTPMLRVAKDLTEEEFHAQVVPIIGKLFQNNDRAMRMPLLEHLPAIVGLIPERVLNDTIFAAMVNGFTDASAQLREMTVKAVVPLAPHLNQRALAHVLRAFAQLQRDEEPAIRTNTTICLGKITQYIDTGSRERVLIAAFCRALLDPFAPARRAGALALSATQSFHSPADCARKVVPAVAPLAIDPEPEVRKAALQCLMVYMAKLEGESRRMAQREAGEEPPPEETGGDAIQVATKEAQESVMESMTFLGSMLGKVGLGGVVPAGEASKAKPENDSGQPKMLQPTPAPPPQPAAPAPPPHTGSGGPSGGAGQGASAVAAAAAAASVDSAGAGDGWGDDMGDILGDADFDTAFTPPSAPAPPPPGTSPGLSGGAMGAPVGGGTAGMQAQQVQPRAGLGPSVAGSGSSGNLSASLANRPIKLGAKKASADWGADADFFADLDKGRGGGATKPGGSGSGLTIGAAQGGSTSSLPTVTAPKLAAPPMGAIGGSPMMQPLAPPPGQPPMGGMGGMQAPMIPSSGPTTAANGQGGGMASLDPLSMLNQSAPQQQARPLAPPPMGQPLQPGAPLNLGGAGPKKLGATKANASDWDANW